MQTILLTFLVILLSLNYLSAKENDTFNDIKKLKNNIDFKIKKFDEDYETVKMILNNDYEDYIKYLVIQRFFRKHSQDIGLTNHDNKIKLNLKVLLNEVNHLIDIKEINNIKKYLSDEYYFNEISSLSNNSNDYDKYDILYNAGKKIKDNKFFEEAYKIKNEQSHSSETEKIKSFLEVCEKQIRYLGLKFCDDSLKKYSNFDFSSNFKKYVNYISNNPNKEVRLGSGVFLEYVNIRVKSYIRNDNYDIPLIVARSRSNKKTSFSKLYKDIAWQMFKSNKHDLLEILIDDLKLLNENRQNHKKIYLGDFYFYLAEIEIKNKKYDNIDNYIKLIDPDYSKIIKLYASLAIQKKTNKSRIMFYNQWDKYLKKVYNNIDEFLRLYFQVSEDLFLSDDPNFALKKLKNIKFETFYSEDGDLPSSNELLRIYGSRGMYYEDNKQYWKKQINIKLNEFLIEISRKLSYSNEFEYEDRFKKLEPLIDNYYIDDYYKYISKYFFNLNKNLISDSYLYKTKKYKNFLKCDYAEKMINNNEVSLAFKYLNDSPFKGDCLFKLSKINDDRLYQRELLALMIILKNEEPDRFHDINLREICFSHLKNKNYLQVFNFLESIEDSFQRSHVLIELYLNIEKIKKYFKSYDI